MRILARVDWNEAKSQIVPLLAHPDHWPRTATSSRSAKLTRSPSSAKIRPPTAIQADANVSGWRISAGVDGTRPDPVDHALEMLLDEIDTPGGTPRIHASRSRPTRHGIGKKGRGTRDTRKRPPTQAHPEGRAPQAPDRGPKRSTPDSYAFADPMRGPRPRPVRRPGGKRGLRGREWPTISQPARHQPRQPCPVTYCATYPRMP